MISLALFLFALLVPFVLASVFARRFTNWTKWRVVLISAAPVPTAAILVIMLLVGAAFADLPSMGGLGMALLSAVPGLVMMAILYALSLGVAAIGVVAARRYMVKPAGEIDEIFE